MRLQSAQPLLLAIADRENRGIQDSLCLKKILQSEYTECNAQRTNRPGMAPKVSDMPQLCYCPEQKAQHQS